MISGHDSNSDSNLVTRIMCAKEQERKKKKKSREKPQIDAIDFTFGLN